MADPGTPRQISDKERREYLVIQKLFAQAQIYRAVFAGQWEEAAALIDPNSRNTFFVGSYNFPGQKKTQQQIDSTGALALEQFCAIADSMVTPKNRKWHALKSNSYVMKDRATQLYFDPVRDILFDFRYRPVGNFHGQNYSNWKSLGAYGNATMFVDRLDTRWHRSGPGLRYRAVPLGETFYPKITRHREHGDPLVPADRRAGGGEIRHRMAAGATAHRAQGDFADAVPVPALRHPARSRRIRSRAA